MKRRLFCLGAIAVIALTSAKSAHAASAALIPCQEQIAKAGGKFVSKKLKAIQKCNEKNLKAPGTCSDIATQILALAGNLNTDLDKKCATVNGQPFNAADSFLMGFPGKCVDPNKADAFTYADLKACMHDSHENTVDRLNRIELGATTGTLASDVLNCQKTIDKDGGKTANGILKAIQKCRNGLITAKLSGFAPEDCATADPKTASTVAKVVSKAKADIQAKCLPGPLAALDVCHYCIAGTNVGANCTVDSECPGSTCHPKATTSLDAANCVVDTHHAAMDDVTPTNTDLADVEYAAAGFCGDGVASAIGEECDGADLSGCIAQGFAGPCGAPISNFPCLCLDIPRERVFEHQTADLDNGWTGVSHDSGVVEGGGYVTDLYDCDNISDFDCTVGPSCSLAPHSPCAAPSVDLPLQVGDAACAALGQGTCRKRVSAVGPHCENDVKQTCAFNAGTCGVGNDCVTTLHGPPLPLAAGGIAVCVVNVFKEDVVGTKNLLTGASSIRLHQDSATWSGNLHDPCPLCGGFCNMPLGSDERQHCTTDADCANLPPLGTITCRHDAVCSKGVNRDKACRPDFPFGGGTTFFGTTSMDCPPGGADSGSILGDPDILFNPATTGSTTRLPTFACDQPGFAGNRCAGGSSDGRTCTTGTECPGGTCGPQCYCPATGGIQERPNGCGQACKGGGNDKNPCVDDSECPGGFCHPGDCRQDPLGPPNEGLCTVGTVGTCSVTTYKGCTNNAGCGGTQCTFCQPGETCIFNPKNCFFSGGLTRTGTPDPVNPTSASTFCITSTTSTAVNGSAGLPGPGALLQPATVIDTGF